MLLLRTISLVLIGVLLTPILSDRVLAFHPEGHATILLYHRFGDQRYPSTSVSMEDFYRQMKFLKENGYRVIPLSRLVEMLERKEPIPPKTVVITIDDAYRSTMRAFEVLREFGFPFTLFLYMEAVGRYPDFLSLEDLKRLRDYGKVEFENHSYSHRNFGFDVDIESFLEDLEKSEERFLKLFGKKPRFYAFPYGFYNLALIEILRQRGYRAVFTQDPGNVDLHSDLFRLNRQAIVGSWSKMDHFLKKLNRENLPLEELIPGPGFLERNPPERVGARLKFPSRYGECSLYVSEIGWLRARREGATVYTVLSGPLKRNWNRIGVRCRNTDTGMWAETFWMVMRAEK
jgi:peptidoglycan/xylan/chitin deacetylase (PgdA/CDA1 family)